MMKESYLPKPSSDFDNLASLDDRFKGQVIDSIFALLVVAISAAPLAFSNAIGVVTIICGLLYAVFYVLFSDGFRNGQSYGKRISKIAVIDAKTGSPCTFVQSLIRNFLLPLVGFWDWIFILGRKRQRLGDLMAGTIVVNFSPPAEGQNTRPVDR